MTRDQILQLAREHGLEDSAAIDRLIAPAAKAVFGKRAGQAAPLSKLGGLPDLPSPTAWPRLGRRSLSFVGQVNLADVPAHLSADLPPTGVLSFFYDAVETPPGLAPADAGSFAVMHFPDATCLTPVERWPEEIPENVRFKEVPLQLESTLTLAPWESVLTSSTLAKETEQEAYAEFRSDFSERTLEEDEWPRTFLLGHPDQIQGDLSADCALVAEGFDLIAKYPTGPRVDPVRRRGLDWRLLFEVSSVREAGMCWADLGALYFWIPREALRRGDFDACWTILQF